MRIWFKGDFTIARIFYPSKKKGAMAMPTCATQKSMGGFCGMSKSLGRAPQPMANVRTGVLTTVHADGSETTRIARTWQSLAVAVDVLESHAFVYFFLCVGVPRRFTRAERTQGVEHRPSLGRGRKVSDRNLPYFFHALAGLACGASSVRKRRAHSE